MGRRIGTVVNVCSRINRAERRGMTYNLKASKKKDGHTACSQKKQISCCVKAPKLVEFIFGELYDLLDPRERPALRDWRRRISKKKHLRTEVVIIERKMHLAQDLPWYKL